MIQRALKCRQRLVADMMLNAFRIALGGLLVDSELLEKRHHDPVTPHAGLGQYLTFLGQENGTIRLAANQSRGLEPRDILGDSGGFDPEAFGDLDGSRLAMGLDQFGDQFDVIFGHLGFVGLTHGREPLCLGLGRPVGGLKGFKIMRVRLGHGSILKGDGGIDNLFAWGRYVSHG